MLLRYTKQLRDAALRNSADQITNLDNLIRCQNIKRVSLPAIMCAVNKFILLVLCVSFPTKVVLGIIGSSAVIVRNLVIQRWTRPMERRADQNVNSMSATIFPRNVIGQRHCVVSWVFENRRQNFATHSPWHVWVSASSNVSIQGLDAAKATDLVARMSLNRSPFFGYKFISHVAVSCAKWLGAQASCRWSAVPHFSTVAICV